jgi:uncharacterized protein (TIGR03435 family)
MLRQLLADRLKLELRREIKDIPVYAMSVGTNGHKMHPATGDGKSTQTFSGKGGMVFQSYSMEELAERLSVRPFRLDRVVFDKTGLNGRFDFTLTLADSPIGLKRVFEGMDLGSTNEDSTVLTVVQEQLGLRFQPQKAPGKTLVVVRAEKAPTEN